MPKILSYANRKGGVGKSSLSIHTVFFLALKEKKRVLLIDLDSQGNSSSRIAPREESESGDIVPMYYGTSSAELFKDELPEIEVMKCPYGIDLIHSPKNDAEFDDIEALPFECILNPKKHLKKIVDDYDYIVVDCPPAYGRKMLAALSISTHVACPVKLSGFSIDGLEGLMEVILGVQNDTNPDLELLGIIVNEMASRSVQHDRSYKWLSETLPGLLFENKIMNRPPIDTAMSDGVPIWEQRYGHVAAKEVEDLMRELLNRMGVENGN